MQLQQSGNYVFQCGPRLVRFSIRNNDDIHANAARCQAIANGRKVMCCDDCVGDDDRAAIDHVCKQIAGPVQQPAADMNGIASITEDDFQCPHGFTPLACPLPANEQSVEQRRVPTARRDRQLRDKADRVA